MSKQCAKMANTWPVSPVSGPVQNLQQRIEHAIKLDENWELANKNLTEGLWEFDREFDSQGGPSKAVEVLVKEKKIKETDKIKTVDAINQAFRDLADICFAFQQSLVEHYDQEKPPPL